MDRSLLFFIIFGVIAGSALLNFIEEIDGSTTELKSQEELERLYQKRAKEYMKGPAGEAILVISKNFDLDQKVLAWNRSKFAKEFASFFPDYNIMHMYIDIHAEDPILNEALHNYLEKIKLSFNIGEINLEQAKEDLTTVRIEKYDLHYKLDHNLK